MKWRPPVRIVGVGSPLGDDALGWEAIRKLQSELSPQPGIEFYRLDGGQRLLDLMDGLGSLLVIDALEPKGNPGGILRFNWPDLRLETLRPGSTHQIGPAEALRLASAIKTLPARVVIYGMEAERFDPQQELSPRVRVCLPELIERIAKELKISD